MCIAQNVKTSVRRSKHDALRFFACAVMILELTTEQLARAS